jgi:hypothetical protein
MVAKVKRQRRRSIIGGATGTAAVVIGFIIAALAPHQPCVDHVL